MKIEKCPVCGWDMKEGGLKVKVAGKTLTVCCDECAAKVREAPGDYVPEAR
jgi:ribosome-binding protein aMBF1 (putative translation factor)